MSYLEKLFSLENKIAVVTGAARGNGKSIAEALLRAGAKVIMVDISEELSDTFDQFQSNNLQAIKYQCDITEKSEIEKLVKFVINNYKKIDILINNAGVTFGNDSLDYTEEEWEKTYKVNLKAPFQISQIIGKHMKERQSGVIINITSLNAEIAFPNNPAYVTFKGALKQLTKSLALDLGKHGIRVNNVGPGYFKTQMTKKSWEDPVLKKERQDRTILGRWGNPEDLAGIIIYLSSESSSYVTGQDFYIDGGWLAKGL
jgi:NAD(P)-dependent dehydrogenase (short-subunit alcohol dehydrogenase family)